MVCGTDMQIYIMTRISSTPSTLAIIVKIGSLLMLTGKKIYLFHLSFSLHTSLIYLFIETLGSNIALQEYK
jgi:hypothetical protein